MHVFDCRTMANIFILVNNHFTLSGFYNHGDNLIFKTAILLGGFGLVLRSQGKTVLNITGYLPLLSHIFSRCTHMITIEGVPKTIFDHGVDKFEIPHFFARTQIGHVRGQTHVLLPAGKYDFSVPQFYMLCTNRNGT